MTNFQIQSPGAEAATELYCTLTGERLHIPGCPHVRSDLRPATPADLLSRTLCSWCRAEINGVGRTYYSSLDDAMRALGCWEGTQPLIREAVRFVRHDQIWLPHSESYIALGIEGRGAAWVGKGYVFVKATGVYSALPGHRDGRGGGAPRDLAYGEVCEVHQLARSLDGCCDYC